MRNAFENTVSMSSPSTFVKRSLLTVTCGLSSAKSRRKLAASSNERSTSVRGGLRAAHLLAERVGILVVRAVDERRALDHDLAHRTPRGAGGGEQVHGADHVDLVQRRARCSTWSRRRGGCAGSCRSWRLARCATGSSTTSRHARTRCARAGGVARSCRDRPRSRRRPAARAAGRGGCPRTCRGR